MQVKRHTLLTPSLGTQRELQSFHYGPAGGRKIYLQGSLHADELPGMLVLYHLKQRLAKAEAQGLLQGEIVVVPMANPIGLSQTLMHDQLGRFEFASGQNFNRGYPDFASALVSQLGSVLSTTDASHNTRLIRQAMAEHLARQTPLTELQSLQHTLIQLACDAEVVLDLHCDFEAVAHLYTESPYWPQAEALVRYLGIETTLLSKGSGGNSFDESCSGIWWQLAERFAGQYPIELACLSATVELRGEADVSHAQADADADALMAYFTHLGLLSGTAPAMPPLRREPTPLAGSETLVAPHPGILVFHRQPGDIISAGETVADIVDPLSDTLTPVKASVSGQLYARSNLRYATRGMDLCKIAGPVAYKTGYLLSA